MLPPFFGEVWLWRPISIEHPGHTSSRCKQLYSCPWPLQPDSWKFANRREVCVCECVCVCVCVCLSVLNVVDLELIPKLVELSHIEWSKFVSPIQDPHWGERGKGGGGVSSSHPDTARPTMAGISGSRIQNINLQILNLLLCVHSNQELECFVSLVHQRGVGVATILVCQPDFWRIYDVGTSHSWV